MREFDCIVVNCGRLACEPEICKLYKNKMSTAKERYYSLFEDSEIGILQEITDYVTELEQELKDSELRRKDLLTSLQGVNVKITELEQQVEELKKAIDFYYKFILEEFKKVCPTK